MARRASLRRYHVGKVANETSGFKDIGITDFEEVISSSTVLRKVLVLFDAGRSGKGKIIRRLKAFDCGFWDHCKYKVIADLFCRSQSPIVCLRGGQMADINAFRLEAQTLYIGAPRGCKVPADESSAREIVDSSR